MNKKTPIQEAMDQFNGFKNMPFSGGLVAELLEKFLPKERGFAADIWQVGYNAGFNEAEGQKAQSFHQYFSQFEPDKTKE